MAHFPSQRKKVRARLRAARLCARGAFGHHSHIRSLHIADDVIASTCFQAHCHREHDHLVPGQWLCAHDVVITARALGTGSCLLSSRSSTMKDDASSPTTAPSQSSTWWAKAYIDLYSTAAVASA